MSAPHRNEALSPNHRIIGDDRVCRDGTIAALPPAKAEDSARWHAPDVRLAAHLPSCGGNGERVPGTLSEGIGKVLAKGGANDGFSIHPAIAVVLALGVSAGARVGHRRALVANASGTITADRRRWIASGGACRRKGKFCGELTARCDIPKLEKLFACRGSSLVERRPEKAGVASSILAPGTTQLCKCFLSKEVHPALRVEAEFAAC